MPVFVLPQEDPSFFVLIGCAAVAKAFTGGGAGAGDADGCNNLLLFDLPFFFTLRPAPFLFLLGISDDWCIDSDLVAIL